MMSQQKTIKTILNDGKKHCSAEFTEVMRIIDYRARISSIRRELEKTGNTVRSEPCRGRCGRKHTAPLNWYWIDTVGDYTAPSKPGNARVNKWLAQFSPELKEPEKQQKLL